MKMMRLLGLSLLMYMALSGFVVAGETVDYTEGRKNLEGYLALPEGTGKVPAVLIVHQWMGITQHEKEIAQRLAKAGYAAFAADIYGKGDRPSNRAEAAQYSGKYKSDIPLFRRRLKAGLETLKKQKRVDPKRVAVIGYCFGGTGALELGRSGADVKAIVSLHGGLSTPDPEDGKNIKGKVLILHGGADKHVSDAELKGVMDELRAADVEWQLMVFSGAVHGFTHRHDADRYHPKAEARSWDAMMTLFGETLSEKK